MKNKNEVLSNKLLLKLSESIGSFIHYWGFKSLQGQIWFLLYITDEEYSTKEIKEIFSISKASASQLINELLDFNVIIKVGLGKHGVDVFKANANILDAIFLVIKNREMNILDSVLENLAKLEKDIDEIDFNIIKKSRLKKLKKLVRFSQSTLNHFLKLQQTSWSKWKIFRD